MKTIFGLVVASFFFVMSAQAEASAWSKISIKDSGYVEEGQCGSFSFSIDVNGFWKDEECGVVKRGKASAARMKSINVVMEKIMAGFDAPLACEGGGVEDYYWTTKVISKSGESKIISSNEGGASGICFRGIDHEIYGQLQDNLRDLRN